MTATRQTLDIGTTRDRLVHPCGRAIVAPAERGRTPGDVRLLQAELYGREGQRVRTSLDTSNFHCAGCLWLVGTAPLKLSRVHW